MLSLDSTAIGASRRHDGNAPSAYLVPPTGKVGAPLTDRHERMLEWLKTRRMRRADHADRIYRNRERYDGTRGQHWMQWDPATRTLRPVSAPRWRVRYTAPHIMSSIERIVSLIGTTPVQYHGVPASNDPEDRESALAVTQFLRALSNDEEVEALRREFVRLLGTDGTCFIQSFWDAAANRSRLQLIEAWNVFCEPAIKKVDHSPVVCIETWENIEELKSDFPDFRWGSFEPSVTEIPPEVKQRLLAMEGNEYGSTGGSDEDLEGIVARRQFLLKPTKKRPRGQFIVMCNDTVIHDSAKMGKEGGLPYIDAGIIYPLSACQFIVHPGRFLGISAVDVLYPQTRIYERGMSRAIEGNNLTASPKIVVGRTTNIEGKFTQEPGEVWSHDAAGGEPAPHFETGPVIQQGFYEPLNMVSAQMYEHIGVEQASRGQLPARVDSGKAIWLLQMADKGRALGLHQEVDRAFGTQMFNCVKMERTYGDGERRRQVFGLGRTAEDIAFTNETFQGTANVWVKSSPTLGYNPQARIESLVQLAPLGIYSPADMRGMVSLPPSDTDQASAWDINHQTATAENLRMMQGEHLPIIPFEMSDVHEATHNDFMQSRWYSMSEEAKAAFVEHMQATTWEKLRLAATAASTGAGMMPGVSQPPQPGKPSGGAGGGPQKPPGPNGPNGPSESDISQRSLTQPDAAAIGAGGSPE